MNSLKFIKVYILEREFNKEHIGMVRNHHFWENHTQKTNKQTKQNKNKKYMSDAIFCSKKLKIYRNSKINFQLLFGLKTPP